MKKPLQPTYDPLPVFAGSKSPAGLYARQKWRHEEHTEGWISDFNETVKALQTGQLANGSWDNSEINTIQRLFGLHLTIREPDDSIARALEWLLSVDKPTHFPVRPYIYNLPFLFGCQVHFVICGSLFLANCFGLGEEKKVTMLYDTIAREIEAKGGHLCSIDCTNNALRAFIVHKRYSRSVATDLMVEYLSRRQLASGRWRGRTPLHMTFNALAHLDSAYAKGQCAKAVENIVKAQNKDGSWGRTQKEWKTFLIVHGLKRLNA